MRTVSVVMTQKIMVHLKSVDGDSKMTVDMPDYCGWAAIPVIAAFIINVNHVRLLAWECAGMFVYYNVFGNGRQIISIPST